MIKRTMSLLIALIFLISQLSVNATFEETGLKLVSKGKTVYASSYASGYQPAFAVDGNEETAWVSSGTSSSWLQIDLGYEYLIERVELSARSDSDRADERNDFKILLSNDSQFNEYVDLGGLSTITDSVNVRNGKAYPFGEFWGRDYNISKRYRYVRYVKTKGTGSLAEIRVYSRDVIDISYEEIEQLLSEGKTVTASKDQTGAQTLVDGNSGWQENNKWNTWENSPYFYIDLEKSYVISKLEWYGRNDCAWELNDAKIYGANSSDFSDKKLITTVSGVSGKYPEWTFTANTADKFRYIRVEKYSPSGTGLGGWEFKVFGFEGENTEISPSINIENNSVVNLHNGENIEITFNVDMDTSTLNTEAVLIYEADSGRRVENPGQFYADDRKLTIIPDNLESNRKYRLYISEQLKAENGQYLQPEFLYFSVVKPEVDVLEFFISDGKDKTDRFIDGVNMQAKARVHNTGEAQDIMLIIAAFDNSGRLKQLDMDMKEAKKNGSPEFSAEITTDSQTDVVKSFILTKQSMQPLAAPKQALRFEEDGNVHLFVSKDNGSDSNDGSFLMPFATLQKAKSAANNLKTDKTVYIHIKNGTYKMEETLSVTSLDSGSVDGKIVYTGVGDMETVISGGSRVSGFEEWKDGIYKAHLDDDIAYIRQMYVNGERRNVASTELLIAEGRPSDGSYGTIVDDEQLSGIEFEDGMEVYYPVAGFRSYTFKLDGITEADGKTEISLRENQLFKNPSTYQLMTLDRKGFYLQNGLQLLDSEGEWYYDSQNREIYYKPFFYEDINELEVYVPNITTLINIGSNTTDIEFKGLTFAHTGWQRVSEFGEARWQSHQLVLPDEQEISPAAVKMQYTNRVNVYDCTFRNLGTVGLGLYRGVKNANVTGNIFTDLSDSSLYVGQYQKPGSAGEVPTNINIKNNVVHDVAKEFHAAPGLQIYGGMNVTVEHNDISKTPYTAVAIGPLTWGVSSELSNATDKEHTASLYGNVSVNYNYIHDICRSSVDGAAIYSLGHNHNSEIAGNYIKNQFVDYGAIYNDDGSACFNIHDNVLENVPGWLYEWSDSIRFITAKNNYSTTNENFGGFFCKYSDIEAVNIFDSQKKPEAVLEVIASAGIEEEYSYLLNGFAEGDKSEHNLLPEFVGSDQITVLANTPVVLSVDTVDDSKPFDDLSIYKWRVTGGSSDKVNFKDSLHGWLYKGVQFGKICATFTASGTYELTCEVKDGSGYKSCKKIKVTVK